MGPGDPLVSDPGGPTWQATSAAAPELLRRPNFAAERLGQLRKSPTGGRSTRARARLNARRAACRLVVVVSPGVGCSVAGIDASGRRSSGADEFSDATSKSCRAQQLRP